MSPKDADRMANSVDLDQTAPLGLGLHCLPRPIIPKIGIITASVFRTFTVYGILRVFRCFVVI